MDNGTGGDFESCTLPWREYFVVVFERDISHKHPVHRQNMADENVEERESDEENLLSQSQELQRLAVGTTTGNEWKAIGYLQYCKFDLRQIAVGWLSLRSLTS